MTISVEGSGCEMSVAPRIGTLSIRDCILGHRYTDTNELTES